MNRALPRIMTGAAVAVALANSNAKAESMNTPIPQSIHPVTERLAQRDMTLLAKLISGVLKNRNPNVSYSHYNEENNSSLLSEVIYAPTVGDINPGKYILTYSGPNNANGNPNPNRVDMVNIMSEQGYPTVQGEDFFIVTSLSFFRNKFKGGGVSFGATYQEGSTTSMYESLSTSTSPVRNEMTLGPKRLKAATSQALTLIYNAQIEKPISEMPLAFTPVPGSSDFMGK